MGAKNNFLAIAYFRCISLVYAFLFSGCVIAQEGKDDKQINSAFGAEIRGRNAVTIAVGATVTNGDYTNPLFEIYSHIGYKRYISPYFNINIGYHKYNIAFKEVFNEGFMSFDANLEIVPFGRSIFSPFIYAGGGYNASNYFESTEPKVQGGAGFEIMAYQSIGIKLFAEYNYMFTDELDGRVFGNSDDAFWRMAIGLNFYFGKRSHKKIKKDQPTVINSNPIIH